MNRDTDSAATMTGDEQATARAAVGMFLGAAVGDALGWPQEVRGGIVGGQKARDQISPVPEFRSWTRNAGHYSSRYSDTVQAGEYSDDTQLLLATARACLSGESWWRRLTEVELPAWPLYQRGGGGAVLSAAGAWADGRPPWLDDGSTKSQATVKRYWGAGANGVAMRIAPHIVYAKDTNELVDRVVRDGLTTHGHPRALVGALMYAFALRQASLTRGTQAFGDSVEAAAAGLIDANQVLAVLPVDWTTQADPDQVEQFLAFWQETTKEASQLLAQVDESLARGAMSNPEATLELLGCTNPKINGAGTVSAAGAVYLASRFATQPIRGLLAAAFLRKADTDTLASLTGAILGGLHGPAWLGPLGREVQDSHYIRAIAEGLLKKSEAPPWPTHSPTKLGRALREAVLARREARGEFADGRRYHIDDVATLVQGKLLRAHLRLGDGQTAYVDVRHPRLGSEPINGEQGEEGVQTGRSPRISHLARSGRTQLSIDLALRDSATTQAVDNEVVVTLLTKNLARCAAFYAQVTGQDIPVSGLTAVILPGVRLTEHVTAAEGFNHSVILHARVPSLRQSARRLGIGIGTDNVKASLEVSDPDGRRVRIVTTVASDNQ